MKQARGFTLIELVVVVAVLGILAAAALPKYMEVTKEARVSTLKATQGAVIGADSMVYGKALISGLHKERDENIVVGVSPEGDDIEVAAHYGHIQNDKSNFKDVLTLSDVFIVNVPVTNTLDDQAPTLTTAIMFKEHKSETNPLLQDKCHIKMVQSPKNGEYTFKLEDSGC